jgi:hypothetical protein
MVKKCCNPQYSAKWKSILLEEFPVEIIDKYGPRVLQREKVTNCFWKDVFSSYRDFYNKVKITNKDEMLAEPLFQNDKFKIDGEVLDLDSWTDAGIYLVRDLIHKDGNFMSLEEFQNQYKIKVPILTYYGYISVVRKNFRTAGISLENTSDKTTITNTYNKTYSILVKALKGTKAFYDAMLGEPSIPNSCKNWEKILNSEINWSKIFFETKKIQEIKLKWFQMKIYYRTLVTNSMLKKMNVTNSDVCSFCNEYKDSILHYLWECEHVQLFWKELVQCLKDKCMNCDRLTINPVLVLFGNDNKTKTDSGFRHILLVAKFFIYKCRINKMKPTLQQFLIDLTNNYKMEQYGSRISLMNQSFVLKWAAYEELITE